MKHFKSILVATFVIAINAMVSCKEKSNGKVVYSGALKTMMSGNLEATISLDTLSRKTNLYALGAMENLKGELQIFDGNPFNSSVGAAGVEIDSSYIKKASLLVYAHVDEWMSLAIPEDIETIIMLESFIYESAVASGISVEEPFPFLIEGTVRSLNWHIINWPKGDMVHTHQKHKESGINGTLNDENVSIVGFYSTKHKAIFTHHTTNMHMHFRTENLAGHIDGMELKKGMKLKLQKK